MRKFLIAGNWKMYKTTAEALIFAERFKAIPIKTQNTEVAICAPFTQLLALKEAFCGTEIKLGAQNMHYDDEGAFTGEISGKMLAEIGVDYCVLGHSERRQYFAETDEAVNRKIHKAFATDIAPILCVGEVLSQRDEGRAFDVVRSQLIGGLQALSKEQTSSMVIAYEPVWAIGTGRTATPEQANEMCGYIRGVVKELYDENVADHVRIQYGGSVKPSNAAELMGMEEIDGALVGGASLSPEDFVKIIEFE